MTEDERRPLGGLHLSGSAGLLAAFGALLYQLLLRDPVFLGGSQSSPEWLTLVVSTLAIGSLAVLSYAAIVPRLGWRGPITALAVLSQWGLPVAIALPALVSGGLTLELVAIVFAAGHVLAAALLVFNLVALVAGN